MSELLVYTVTAGWYRDYVPLFKRCLFLQYPEYDCIVSELDIDDNDEALIASSIRFLAEPETDCPYIFITDIDMMPLRQDPSILKFHVDEMKESGLCYSNSIRGSEPLGDHRITGLHFVNKEWYRKTEQARADYMKQVNSGSGLIRYEDEMMLKQIVLKSGLEMCGGTNLVKRHGGIHLGTIRAYRWKTRQTLSTQLTHRIPKSQALAWLSNYEDKEFCEIEKETRAKNQQIDWHLDRLNQYCQKKRNSP